ncbi:MAG: hypothetical protein J7M05_01720, partial [Anaerolineae bacterium]|nr:hypothetical protein [Anaerolineae bacterium]
MIRAIRILFRLVTAVLAISAVILILGGGFWYMWQSAKGQTPQVSYTFTTRKVERAILGLYLRYRGQDVSRPANPNDNRQITFIIEQGETVSTVAYHLKRMGLITDPELFRR